MIDKASLFPYLGLAVNFGMLLPISNQASEENRIGHLANSCTLLAALLICSVAVVNRQLALIKSDHVDHFQIQIIKVPRLD